MSCISIVFVALSHYEVYKKTKKRSHLRAARKYTKIINGWVENGNINCAPGLALLKAEEVSLTGDLLKIKEAYDDAIGIADRDGFRQYEALATERAGLVFKGKGDKKRAIAYLRQSCLLYEQWGAMGKVEDIQQKYIRGCCWYT
jgi:predicted negative regulator of RcsB-dependent stress response